MAESLVGAGAAIWLGILTSLSPCPLAANIAALSFIGRRLDSPAAVLASGALYTIGRSMTYAALGSLLVFSLVSTPFLSHVLQKYSIKIMGLLLILVGMVLLGLIELRLPGWSGGDGLQRRADRWGLWGAGLLGIVFALSFCPVSGALFFGSLLPIAVRDDSPLLYPAIYGIGTALPVVVVALFVAFGARSMARVFNRMTQFELWARKITGVVFILVGLFTTLGSVFGVFSRSS
jgi:cytochrome c biogenesis protein CcdA